MVTFRWPSHATDYFNLNSRSGSAFLCGSAAPEYARRRVAETSSLHDVLGDTAGLPDDSTASCNAVPNFQILAVNRGVDARPSIVSLELCQVALRRTRSHG